MKDYIRLLKFLNGHQKSFVLAVIFMLFSSLLEGVQFSLLVPLFDIVLTHKKIVPPNYFPEFIKNFVEQINQIPPQTLMTQLMIGVVVLLTVKNAVIFCYGYFMNDLSQKVMQDIRNKLYIKIQSLSLDYFSKKRTGELISRITNDVNVVENAVSYGVTDLFKQTFTILGSVIVAFMINSNMTLVILFVFPLIAFPIQAIGRKLKKLGRSVQEKMADINSLLLETISGVKVVRAFCTEKYEIDRFGKQNYEYYRLRMKSIRRILWINPITELVGAGCGMIIVFWLGSDVINGKISFGIFTLYFATIMMMISPIKKLGNVNALTQQALAANERVYEVLDRKSSIVDKPTAAILPSIKSKISFENVSFYYDEESGLVLKNISVEAKRGELLAIVGPTGSGKTTLANLVGRFYDPTLGTVKIDGIDLKDVTVNSLRSQIGIVAQETFLFNDSVASNIAYGITNISQPEIESAAKKAFAHHFIFKMPQGYQTTIGDRGVRLSGGEKQRISIARAILRNPPILILDEATSSLDSESEKFVQEALDKLMQGRTVIAIAHRLSTIIRADKILVLDHGSIVGVGRHDELLKTCDLYRRLYETQFQL